MKTIYLFFEIGNRVRKHDSPFLYAFTLNKKYAKEFQNTRDMSLFYMDVKSISKNELNEFLMDHGKLRLVKLSFNTVKIEKSIRKLSVVSLIGTVHEDEYVCLNEDKIAEILTKYTNPFGKVLNDKYLSSLNFFMYFDFAKMKQSEIFHPFYSGLFPNEDFYEDPYYNIPNMKYDQLEIFLYFFGYTILLKNK